MPIEKEEIKPSGFADDMILYIKKRKTINATKKLLELINKFSKVKVTGNKINILKYTAFLYANNEKSDYTLLRSSWI